MSTGFRVIGTFAALAVFAVSAMAIPAGAVAKKKKPDLVVKKAELTGQPYGFIDEGGNKISFRDQTFNGGKGDADKSITRLILRGADGTRFGATSRRIGKLKSKETDKGAADKTWRLEPPRGGYALQACADFEEDVKESNEENNCASIPGQQFYILERIWSGSITGTGCLVPGVEGGCEDVHETWSSDNATFTFEQYLGAGVFNYNYRGVGFYLDQGTDSRDCTWSSGGGANASSDGSGTLVLDYLTNQYNATVRTPLFYTITEDCFGVSMDFEHRGPWYEYLLQTSRQSGAPTGNAQPLPFGHIFVQGSFTGSGIGNAGDPDVTWTWELQ